MKRFLIFLCSLSISVLYSQEVDFTLKDFKLTGTAQISGEETFRLTESINWQGGGVWYKDDIDLSKPFEMELEMYFGCSDDGADGIVFIFHPELRTGFRGEGMGFGGLFPSFGVEMDTYENFHLSDPSYDHVALIANGMMRHPFGITQPVPMDENRRNVEDCDYHKVNVKWDPSSMIFQFFFDGAERINKKVDLIGEIFENNPYVYWGFTSATGGKNNRHQIRLKKLEFTENLALKYSDMTALIEGREYILRQLDFSSGSTRLPESAKPELDKLIQFFKRYPDHTIILDSFTDSSGKESSNLKLSKLRAEAVAKYLIANGLPKDRILFYGNGEANPIESNETEAGRKKNRRVEIRMKVIKV